MLEKMEISFDENGEPNNLQLHVSPETYNQIKDQKFTPEQEKRHKDIIEKKRRLWYIKSLLENYLTSILEVEFFGPFKSLLEGLGYYDIHLIHSPVEFGKDFIAKKDTQEGTIQFCFQIKIGDINLNKFTNEIKPQLLEIVTNSLSHPNFDKSIPLEIIFVTTGNLKPPATIAFQAFNNYLNKTLKRKSILTWEKDQIISDFYKIGIEPFFELHNSPEFLVDFIIDLRK